MRAERNQYPQENNSAQNVGPQSDGVEESKAKVLIFNYIGYLSLMTQN